MVPKFFKTFLLIVALLAAAPAQARNQKAQQYQAIFTQLQKLHRDKHLADEKMVAQMRSVIEKLKVYLRHRREKTLSPHLLPLDKEEEEELISFLGKDSLANPYASLSKPNQKRFLIHLVPSISPGQLKPWRQKAPKAWQEAPGSISILHNGYDFILVWGASIDGAPIKIDKRTKIVSLRIKR